MLRTIRPWFAVMTGISAPGMGRAPTTAFCRAFLRMISSHTARLIGGFRRVSRDGQGSLLPGGLARFVEHPVEVSEADQSAPSYLSPVTGTDVKLILGLFQIYYVQATGEFQLRGPRGELATPA